jgi:hypothetical protein
MKTKMKAGRCVAAYVDDGMGRRLVLGVPDGERYQHVEPITVAQTQGEAQDLVRVLRELAQELPP